MGSKSKKILEEIHPLRIIREVQKWPLLYTQDSSEPANQHFKKKIWMEIAKALFTDWDSYTESEQSCKINDLTKRWRNLRDTFKRQLATEKKIREGHNIKKKTYVYFKHMLFLLPHFTTPEIETRDPVLEPKLNAYFNKREKRKGTTKEKEGKRKKLASKPILEEASVKKEEIDEDKHFLLSLIPSFKKMSDDEKLTAKVEILKVIKCIRSKSITEEYNIPVVDTLSLNMDDNDLDDVKVEMLHSELDENISNTESESDENSN